MQKDHMLRRPQFMTLVKTRMRNSRLHPFEVVNVRNMTIDRINGMPIWIG
jgi:hypothetical protein